MSAVQTQTSTWKIDKAHSHAEFKVKHMMISNVKGQFSGIDGLLTLDEHNVTQSGVDASIDVSSVATGDLQRDAHLKSADFFDVEKFPQLTFKSTQVSGGDGELKVTGDLTMLGKTKSITFPAKLSVGGDGLTVSSKFTIDRTQWGMTYGVGKIDNDVKLTVSVKAK